MLLAVALDDVAADADIEDDGDADDDDVPLATDPQPESSKATTSVVTDPHPFTPR